MCELRMISCENSVEGWLRTQVCYIEKKCKRSFFFSLVHSPDSSYETMTSKWPSVWVKISSSWIGIVLYVWTLVAPLVLTNRDFD